MASLSKHSTSPVFACYSLRSLVLLSFMLLDACWVPFDTIYLTLGLGTDFARQRPTSRPLALGKSECAGVFKLRSSGP